MDLNEQEFKDHITKCWDALAEDLLGKLVPRLNRVLDEHEPRPKSTIPLAELFGMMGALLETIIELSEPAIATDPRLFKPMMMFIFEGLKERLGDERWNKLVNAMHAQRAAMGAAMSAPHDRPHRHGVRRLTRRR